MSTVTFTASNKSIANGTNVRLAPGRCNGETHVGVTVRSDQVVSVAIAWGRDGDTPSAEDSTSASLPYLTPYTSFASNAGTAEKGTQHTLALPPMASVYQLVLSNNSGATATVSRVDWALQDNVVKESC